MKPMPLIFAVACLLVTVSGIFWIVGASQSRPLPQYSQYTDKSSFTNKTNTLVTGVTTSAVPILVPIILLLLLLFVVAVLIFVFGHGRGW